ncbi:MAG: 50S ribosomal protein L4 [Thermoguttaceae bacterium]|nr:50S ribosomal protein L4 [Thermoguttaceae bacterium]
MTNLPIFDKTGAQVGTYEVDTDLIAPKISKQLLHDAVVMYQSNLRQGSSKTKSRAEVSGSKKKMYRQKGTGNARAGHKRSGVRRGGGHIFAKRPQDWTYRLPRKALQVATRMALVTKINAELVKLIDVLQMDAPRTKEVAGILNQLSLTDTSLLIVVDQYDLNVYKSARNISRVRILPVAELNAYEILRPKQLLLTRSAMDRFMETKVKKAEVASAN